MNSVTDLWGRCVLVCILLLTLSGCQDPDTDGPQPTPTVATPPAPESFSCSIFDESQWQEFRFGVDSPAEVVATVARSRVKSKDEIWTTSLSRGVERVDWDEFGDEFDVSYTAWFRDEQGLFRVMGYWRSRPTLAQVMDCLGIPEYYEATYFIGVEALLLSLKLWYIKRGIIIQHSSIHYDESPPAIDAEYRVGRFYVLAPGKPEDMVVNAYVDGDDPDVQTYGLCVLKPWPGSIEALEVDSLLDDPRCEYDTPTMLGRKQHDGAQQGS